MDFPLEKRTRGPEMMDDASIRDDRLTRALHNIQATNRWLGGHAASTAYFDPLFRRHSTLQVLDVGAGLGDVAAHLVRRGQSLGCHVRVRAVDNNPTTVHYAQGWLDARLAPALRSLVSVEVGDATALDPAEYEVDVAHAALFLHHFYGNRLRRIVRIMNRCARCGIVINDLHRHPLAYVGIWVLTRLLPVSPMYRHDAPLSVRRGFRRSELLALAQRAGCSSPTIRWHWAFRWVLSTLPSSPNRPSFAP